MYRRARVSNDGSSKVMPHQKIARTVKVKTPLWLPRSLRLSLFLFFFTFLLYFLVYFMNLLLFACDSSVTHIYIGPIRPTPSCRCNLVPLYRHLVLRCQLVKLHTIHVRQRLLLSSLFGIPFFFPNPDISLLRPDDPSRRLISPVQEASKQQLLLAITGGASWYFPAI